MNDSPLPTPFVPLEIDLRGYEFMPLFGDIMLGSRFNATTNDTAWRIGVTLWWRSWNNQVPAASLPDDDGELAMLAGLGRDVKTFRKVRALALHGWVKCSDGRLYHTFLSQYAIEAWKGRRAHQQRTLKARIAALEKRMAASVTDNEKARIATLLQDLRAALSESVTDQKVVSDRACPQTPEGEVQGQGQGEVQGEGEDEVKATPNPNPVAGESATPPARRARKQVNGETPPSVAVWEAYASAYEQRYTVPPTPNGKVRGQIAHFVTRLPHDEAALVAAFYVRSNRGLYVSAGHCIDLLVRDAEKLRTEWATGKAGTETEARQADRTQATGNAFAPLIAEAREREKRGTH